MRQFVGLTLFLVLAVLVGSESYFVFAQNATTSATSTISTATATPPVLFELPTLPEIPTLPEPLSLRITPESPSPGQTFRVVAHTPTFTTYTTDYVWTINGVEDSARSGLGKNTIELVAPRSVGSTIRIGVEATSADGRKNAITRLVTVSELTLAWNAETYVPLWYAGKALPSRGSVVRIVAFPEMTIEGRRVAPESLIYRWNVDERENVKVGRGERVFRVRVTESPYISHQVSVIVEDLGGNVRKARSVFISPTEPRAAIYTISPLGGVEARRALESFAVKERGALDFAVEPFFFPVHSKNELAYEWNIPSAAVEGEGAGQPHILTLTTERQPAGAYLLSVTIRSVFDFLSPLTKTFNLVLP